MSKPNDEQPAVATSDCTLGAEPASLPSEVAVQDASATTPKGTLWQKIYDCVTYVPPRCRYDPEKPFQFSMGLNLLFCTSSMKLTPTTCRQRTDLLDVMISL